ncbi:nucleoside kinase [bacterium]|nr:nucleoside kinase [bacterium]
MINIELYKDDIAIKNIEIEKANQIRKIVNGFIENYDEILSFKINNKRYQNDNYLISEDCKINCITYNHIEGKRIYQDSVIFILTKAVYNIFADKVQLVVEHSIDDGVFCELFGLEDYSEKYVYLIQDEMQKIANKGLWIDKLKFTWEEAKEILSRQGRKDLIKNLDYYSDREIYLYKCGDYYDFYSRPLADNTKNVPVFKVGYQEPGLILRFPQRGSFTMRENIHFSEKVFAAHQLHDKWLNNLKVHNIIDINKLIDTYEIGDFILHEEALHEKKIANIADEIAQTNKKIILIAGPSSSGKTTFSHRLAVQLLVSGLKPIVIGLDDYFLGRDRTPILPNGEYDFESIHALDLELLNNHLKDLLAGQEIELPKYNFGRGLSENSGKHVKLCDDNVIVMEGIHGLNPELTAQIPDDKKVKIYVTALNQLNIDNHNRIPTTDCRKIRRSVRDYYYRGYSANETLSRWQSVRDGENRNIFPYQENADYIFNSGLTYELGCLKSHAYKELKKIPECSPNYTEAKRLLILLGFIKDIPEKLVPNNSILREFIGGSVFIG